MADIKWSAFPSIGALASGDILVGLRAGANVRFTALTLPWSATLGGTGVANAAGSTITLGGAFTMSGAFAFTGTLTGITSVTFPTSGTLATTATASGIVNSALINQVAWYSASGNAVNGLTTAASGVLVTSAGGVPSISTTLPSNLAMQTPASIVLTNATALPVPGGLTATGTPSATTFLRGDGTWSVPAGTGVTSVSGTTNRITSTGGNTPVIDISASYVGQSSITTLGTIGTGVWQGTVVGSTYGGTGVNNGASTITLGGSLTTSGAFASTFTMTNTTAVTFPTNGTLQTTAGASGIISSGLINQATYYAAAGTTVSGAANVFIQNSVANLQVTRPTPASSGALIYLDVSPAADTNLTSSQEVNLVGIGTPGVSRQWATGAISLQRDVRVSQPTYAFVGASTITDAATVGITGPVIRGTNATITNSHGLYIGAGSNLNAVSNAYGLTVFMPSGITGSFAVAQFRGLNGACRGVAIGTGSPQASLHITRDTASSSGVLPYLLLATTADTGGTASTECPVFSVNGQNKTWAAGAITTQRSNLFSQPTYAFASASTITNAANIGIVGAPIAGTSATLTNTHGLLISTGAVTSGATNSYGLSVNAMTGAATANYAAQFIGGNSGFGTAAPAAMVHILNTTEQLRVAYDASNYYSTTVGSTGGVTFDAVGSGSLFTFSDGITGPSVVLTKVNGTEASNAVTASGNAGVITTSSLTTAGGANYAITWTNTAITATSGIQLQVVGGTNTVQNYRMICVPGAGTATLTIYNNTAATALNGTILISYLVV